MKKTGETSKET